MDKIIIVDFGSQYTQLIARRIRELNVYAEIVDYELDAQEISQIENVAGIIFSGGPQSVNADDAYIPNDKWFDLNVPLLGICYGMQYCAKYFGGVVEDSVNSEYGNAAIEINEQSLLFNGLENSSQVWMSHGCSVTQLPDGFVKTAVSSDNDITAFENTEKMIFGIQFHLEVSHSELGMVMLNNFLFSICKITNKWLLTDFVEQEIQAIRDQVGNEKVIMGISGGVDSAVAAKLLYDAIGDNLTCVYVDHGLMRKDESIEVMDYLTQKMQLKVVKVDAKELFLTNLEGITDPEQKRKIIGKLFIDCFKNQIDDSYSFLGQGTLYTDIIESGSKNAQTIKSHHNVGGLPKDLNLKLIEPLNKLFKDEVRNIGRLLNIDDLIINRQPFPGPGLAIRILGDINQEKITILQNSDAILRHEIKARNLDQEIWQYFCVLTNCKTVGVKGDERTYSYTLAIRCVSSIDGMTADFSRIDLNILGEISREITNNVPEINRVVYDITSKPPATIEWE